MSGKKISSNLAEYKNGQLTCIVCRIPVKNELYWTGHVNGRQHRDSINALKRKLDTEGPPASKKSKVDETFAKPKPPPSSHAVPVPQDVQDRIIFKSTKNHPPTSKPTLSEAPLKKIVQFEDEEEEVPAPGSANTVETKKEDLPEGFFDDPKEDAKVRGKEFVDPEEAEWNKFLKEIATEEIQSESLLVVDEEESRKERELDEIEDMMTHWQRVIDLEKKKETRVKKMESDSVGSDSSGDETDFNEELDWRVKKF
ncbi:unnamed protein product [Allacma fusca]|uniref:ZNF380 coiled-coil domain-containing protein n=1 Tax=Allacma fusca TaxID=39272 RepID=A0A8J2NYR1_9HEXA|nr:unnamed protein product [Allacma fusca]